MKKSIIAVACLALLAAGAWVFFRSRPDRTPEKQDRKILYWTDPMLPGDRSDHPGKSPMGMERVPVYAEASDSATAEYYCPMHPKVVRDKPGVCDICGMTLVRRSAAGLPREGSPPGFGSIVLPPSRQVLAHVAAIPAVKKGGMKTIRGVGTITVAEPSLRHITPRFAGRVEKLYLSYTGQTVGEGDPVAELYSPEAISAQKEYLLARDSYGEVKDSPQLISAGAKDLLDQSRQKLVLWGFTEKQMAVLESTKEVRNVVTINSPIRGTVLKKNVEVQKYVAAGDDLYDLADLSTVWVEADIYEYDMEWVRPGQKVRVSSRAFPGVDFSGSVSFIGATVDPATRTAKLRTALSNSGERLKPGMYVDVDVNVPLPPSILVPATAVLSTGNRTLVWVQKDSNLFQPRQVRVGTRAGDDVQILEGLNEGDRVVVSGGYLLDSESQLEGSAEMEREKLNTPDIDSRR